MQTLIKNHLSLSTADGTPMQVYVSYPADATRLPGILVLQEAFGVNAHIRDVADRIAAEGYYAIAPELFHRTADKGLEISYDDLKSAQPHLQALDGQGLTDDLTTTHKFMCRQTEVDPDRTASIGFCLGGRVSFLASTVLPLKAAACFYGGDLAAMAGDRVAQIPCPLLLCWGGQDAHIPRETRDKVLQQLDQAEKDYVQVVFSKAGHAFFCDQRDNYHPASARESWALVKAFWKVHL